MTITAGVSRVASGLLGLHAIAITPAGEMDFIRSYYFHPRRPSPITRWVGSCITCFEACSAFTHVMACTLAKSPSDPLHPKLPQLRCLRRRFDCYRVERTSSRAGVAPAEAQRLFTAHAMLRQRPEVTASYAFPTQEFSARSFYERRQGKGLG